MFTERYLKADGIFLLRQMCINLGDLPAAYMCRALYTRLVVRINQPSLQRVCLQCARPQSSATVPNPHAVGDEQHEECQALCGYVQAGVEDCVTMQLISALIHHFDASIYRY
jgi:hypothetical protein